MGLILLRYAAMNAQTGEELFGILKSYRFISVILTVYIGAYGSLFTGLAYSLCTNRGFIRHKWVILKWVITLSMIIYGDIVLGPWSASLLEVAGSMGLEALQDPDFLYTYRLHMRVLIIYILLFIVSTAISVYKPWELQETMKRQGQPDQV